MKVTRRANERTENIKLAHVGNSVPMHEARDDVPNVSHSQAQVDRSVKMDQVMALSASVNLL